jgi:CSLREA domain-containing protein
MRIKRLFTVFALGLGLTLALLHGVSMLAARAADIKDVNTTADNTTAGDGDCTLREAIYNANNDSDGSSGDCTAGSGDDTITLPAGTYVLTQTGDGDTIGDLDILGAYALTITGAGPASTIIDANGIDRVLDIGSDAGTTVVISGVKIMGGNVTGNGGGINNPDADMILINTIVFSNSAGGRGGGVFVGFGSATVSGGQIVGNTAVDMGGGIHINFGDVTLNGGEILSNTVSGHLRNGGGVYVNVTDAVFTQTGDSMIAYNTASSGGGV